MSDLAQKFRRMSLFLKRVSFIGGTHNLDISRDEFPFLSFALRRDQGAINNNRSTSAESLDVCVIRKRILPGDDLEISQRGTVIQFDK